MLVHALVSTVRAHPEPSVLLVLNGLDEVFAHLVGGCLGVAVFAQHDLSQLSLVPLVHVVLLLGLLFRLLLLVSAVGVQTPLFGLALDGQVVREFAPLALFAVALLEELAEDRLGVDTEWHLLDLYGLEEVGHLLGSLLSGGLVLLPLRLLGSLALLLGGSSRGGRGVDLLDVLLRSATLLVLHTEGLVDGDLLHLGLLALAFGWHIGGCELSRK